MINLKVKMAYQQREEGKMTEYYCNYIKEPQISGVYSHLNNGVVVDFNNLVQVFDDDLGDGG